MNPFSSAHPRVPNTPGANNNYNSSISQRNATSPSSRERVNAAQARVLNEVKVETNASGDLIERRHPLEKPKTYPKLAQVVAPRLVVARRVPPSAPLREITEPTITPRPSTIYLPTGVINNFNIPNEVLVHVFSFLPANFFNVVKLVCHFFYEVITKDMVPLQLQIESKAKIPAINSADHTSSASPPAISSKTISCNTPPEFISKMLTVGDTFVYTRSITNELYCRSLKSSNQHSVEKQITHSFSSPTPINLAPISKDRFVIYTQEGTRIVNIQEDGKAIVGKKRTGTTFLPPDGRIFIDQNGTVYEQNFISGRVKEYPGLQTIKTSNSSYVLGTNTQSRTLTLWDRSREEVILIPEKMQKKSLVSLTEKALYTTSDKSDTLFRFDLKSQKLCPVLLVIPGLEEEGSSTKEVEPKKNAPKSIEELMHFNAIECSGSDDFVIVAQSRSQATPTRSSPTSHTATKHLFLSDVSGQSAQYKTTIPTNEKVVQATPTLVITEKRLPGSSLPANQVIYREIETGDMKQQYPTKANSANLASLQADGRIITAEKDNFSGSRITVIGS